MPSPAATGRGVTTTSTGESGSPELNGNNRAVCTPVSSTYVWAPRSVSAPAASAISPATSGTTARSVREAACNTLPSGPTSPAQPSARPASQRRISAVPPVRASRFIRSRSSARSCVRTRSPVPAQDAGQREGPPHPTVRTDTPVAAPLGALNLPSPYPSF